LHDNVIAHTFRRFLPSPLVSYLLSRMQHEALQDGPDA